MRFFLFQVSMSLQTLDALSFGALGFLVLKEWRRARAVWGGRFFGYISLACSLYYGLQLASGLLTGSPAGSVLGVAGSVVKFSLPPLVLHLLYVQERTQLKRPRVWSALVCCAYCAAIGSFLTAIDAGFAIDMAFAMGTGILLMWRVLQNRSGTDRQPYNGLMVLFGLLVAANCVRLRGDPGWSAVMGDLVPALIIFLLGYSVHRFAFFDVLVKKISFYCLGLAVVSAYFYWVTPVLRGVHWHRRGLWVHAIAISPLLLSGTWVYARWSPWLDRVWLGRRFTPLEAAQHFMRGLHSVVTEQELVIRAEELLGAIFGSRATITLGGMQAVEQVSEGGMDLRVPSNRAPECRIGVAPRSNRVRFLSEDMALLSSLAGVFSMMLENLRLREEHLAEKWRAKELLLLSSRSELRALRAQINPHFLFNALSAIAGLITRDPGRAEITVEQLAEVFRYTLYRSDKEWVRLSDELAFVAAYLQVEQSRLGNRLQVELDIDEAARTGWVPVMALQVIVENAVKHGVAPMRQPGLVQIRARRCGDRLCLEVRDNGRGFPDSPDTAGFGLRNVQQRLRGYFGEDASLRVGRRESMTSVALEMPFFTTTPEGVKHDVTSNSAG